MRIAVPTNDGKSISEHFGRSASFLVFEVENDQVKNRETRANEMQHSHEQGNCHNAAGRGGPHSHASLVSTLAGCEVVLCAGYGPAGRRGVEVERDHPSLSVRFRFRRRGRGGLPGRQVASRGRELLPLPLPARAVTLPSHRP